jgi:hypothetical protein
MESMMRSMESHHPLRSLEGKRQAVDKQKEKQQEDFTFRCLKVRARGLA